MKVDIIIPTYKPDDTFCLLLQKLQEQTFVVHKVIILNTEQALWEEAVRNYPIVQALSKLSGKYKIVHIAKKEFDHGGTRMLGAQISKGDIMVFVTQDAIPADSELLKRLLISFEDERVAVAYARQLPNTSCSVVEQYTRQFNYPLGRRKKGKADLRELGIKTYFCSDVCAAYRKDIFTKLGGFEEPVIFNEDMFFAAKAIHAGYYVEYAGDANVIHSHNYSMKQQFHRNFDLAVSQQQHPEFFEVVSSESEGIKLVWNTVKYLFSAGKPYLIFHLFLQCIGKYAGFFMGKRYRKLSRKRILKYTMNQDYWKRIWKEL